MSLSVSLIARYDPRSWLSLSGALPNYRVHLYFVNQSTSRYDNSVMNNICAVGVVRAYLSSRVCLAIEVRTPDIGYQEQYNHMRVLADIVISAYYNMLLSIPSNICPG